MYLSPSPKLWFLRISANWWVHRRGKEEIRSREGSEPEGGKRIIIREEGGKERVIAMVEKGGR